MKRTGVYLLSVISVIYGCNTISKSNDKKPSLISYELVPGWPQLAAGYSLGQPTGMGVDSKDHIFVFHRTGRKWTEPFPDS